MSNEPVARPHPEPVVLDIGGDVGALLVHADPSDLDLQIEISPTVDDASRTHQHILERPLDGRTAYAAVFDRITEGNYTLWTHGVARARDLKITGGAVAELDWRTSGSSPDREAPPGLNHRRTGHGEPLVLIHGLGSSLRTWDTVLAPLAGEREVIALDLPGFGATPPLAGRPTIAALTDAVAAFLREHDLEGVDVVGSSMGARIALELARRGEVGATVALDPGGFWAPHELRLFELSVGASIRLVRALQPAMAFLTATAVTRALLFAQFSARPWRLGARTTLNEMRDFASSPTIMQTLHELVHGPPQEGAPAGSARGPIVIGWGRSDRVTLPSQAHRAQALFPDARLHWFEGCGHFPHWDVPAATARLILETTA